MLNPRVKDLISQYADDALDLETTRKVADLVAGSPEADTYFTQLQRLRHATARTLGQLPAEDRSFDSQVFEALRHQSFQPTLWERLVEKSVLAPRFAFAASIVLIILILALFSRYEPQLSSFFSRTEQTVDVLQEEARRGLHSLTRSAGLSEDGEERDSQSPSLPAGSDGAASDGKAGEKIPDEWRVAGSPGGML